MIPCYPAGCFADLTAGKVRLDGPGGEFTIRQFRIAFAYQASACLPPSRVLYGRAETRHYPLTSVPLQNADLCKWAVHRLGDTMQCKAMGYADLRFQSWCTKQFGCWYFGSFTLLQTNTHTPLSFSNFHLLEWDISRTSEQFDNNGFDLFNSNRFPASNDMAYGQTLQTDWNVNCVFGLHPSASGRYSLGHQVLDLDRTKPPPTGNESEEVKSLWNRHRSAWSVVVDLSTRLCPCATRLLSSFDWFWHLAGSTADLLLNHTNLTKRCNIVLDGRNLAVCSR